MPTTTLSHDRRYLCSELVTVQWSLERGPTRETTANLEEIWSTGAVVLSETRIPENVPVRIQTATVVLTGSVRSSLDSMLGNFVEIDFAPSCLWDPGVYLPEHLLDPAVLLGFPTMAPAA
ncbi:MAG TPA: hypothetical protein DEH78_23535 [Solibacterales bacterium]|nr:hypothetical protein [Bryobacterales bacterium]